ncbi:hypothetical protein [Paenibacillus sp. PL2-23]|uniref:hypothetical protein n=1 Tax=Paenibacillus sp. PL2-23 TaxID=2100729 RepID=UPI0030FCA2C8
MYKKERWYEKLFFWFGLLFLSTYVLLPILNMLIASVKPLEEIQISGNSLLPEQYDFGTYIRMWKTVPLLDYILNTPAT